MDRTIADFLRARAQNEHIALHHFDQQWTYREYVALCAQRAAFLLAHRQPGPFHVGILLGNVPEFAFWLGACVLSGATFVGLNTTRRGADMARDIEHTNCQFVITAEPYLDDVQAMGLSLPPEHILDVNATATYARLQAFAGAPLPDVTVRPTDIFSLIFSSGTTGSPKACICSHGRVAQLSSTVAQYFQYNDTAVSYVPMPWFHAAAINMGWLPAIIGGSAVVIRKFSVSGFMPDVRRYGVTHFNYVGKPLAYLLTAPEQVDDADNTLRIVHGNEGSIDDQERFAQRYRVRVVDGYGSTEGGPSISRTPDMPRGCLGMPLQEGVIIMNPATEQECPRARFDAQGRFINPNEAIGEIVNLHGADKFEGYWNNPEAENRRVRNGIFWTGDLGYRDEQGYFWFAGRDDDWLRVDGENIASAQIEQALVRHPDVVLAGVYAVPDHRVGDRVMAALELRPGRLFDPDAFETFMLAQPDFGTKWQPSFVRITTAMPVTATSKVLRRQLRQERWHSRDPIWWKPEPHQPYRALTATDVAHYEGQFAPGVLERLR